MYKVIQYRKAPKAKALQVRFTTYEAARSAVRKHLRSATKRGLVSRKFTDWGFYIYDNPSIGSYGYRVVKV